MTEITYSFNQVENPTCLQTYKKKLYYTSLLYFLFEAQNSVLRK